VGPLQASSLMNMPPAGTVAVDTLKRVVLRHKESVSRVKNLESRRPGGYLPARSSFHPCISLAQSSRSLCPLPTGPRGDGAPARRLRDLVQGPPRGAGRAQGRGL
jgi:hypothetical protein